MKMNKIFYLAVASALTVSCADLDTAPQGGTVTADQKAEVAANDDVQCLSEEFYCSS